MREFEQSLLILQRIPYKDSDLLVLGVGALTGKELFRARSARKIPNKWKCSFSEGSIIRARVMKLNNYHILTGVISEDYVPAKHDLSLVLALEILARLPSVEGSLFDIATGFVTSNREPGDFDKFLVQVMIKEGLQPSFNRCVMCGSKREGFPISVSVARGGYVCANCGGGELEITEADYKSLLEVYGGSGELTGQMRKYWLDHLEVALDAKLLAREGAA
ncbi:hypothetical protein HPY42_02765 [Coprothermobacteraceae bacterium]|nr:hypothetical protein [Coprothermobacteraceae bacterium]